MNKIITTTLRIPIKLLKSIKIESDKLGISKNALILNILWEWAQNSKGKEQTK